PRRSIMPRSRSLLRTVPFTCIGLASFLLLVLAASFLGAEPDGSIVGAVAMGVLRILIAPAYLVTLLTLPLAERISGMLGVGGAWLWWIGFPLRILPFAAVDGALALVR